MSLVRKRFGKTDYLYQSGWDRSLHKQTWKYLGKDSGVTNVRFEIHKSDFRALELEPDSVDLILTDPPYSPYRPPEPWVPFLDAIGQFAAKVLRPGGFFICFMSQLDLPEAFAAFRPHLDYITEAVSFQPGKAGRYSLAKVNVRYTPILIYQKGDGPPPRLWWDDVVRSSKPEKGHHPWQKNFEVVQEFVRRFSSIGDLVVDPFLGSGTTAIAARGLARGFVGCDVSPATIAIAQRRIEAELGVSS